MFPALDRVRGSACVYATGEKPMATVLTPERNDPNQCRDQFTRRLWPHTKRSILSTSRADHLTLHPVLISATEGMLLHPQSHYKGLSLIVKLIAVWRKSALISLLRHEDVDD